MTARRPPRAAVRAAVRECVADLEPGERVIVALSGGADSLALTAAAVVVGAELGLLCEAVVIDHQLQVGSREVAQRAADQARILGCVAARVIGVDVPRGSGSGGVEAAARGVRYAALDAAAGVVASSAGRGHMGPGPDEPGPLGPGPLPPAAAILLGHTRDDQAETVLLGLARGSGTRSLAGMAARTGVYRRPLLDLSREVVVAAALEAAAADPRLQPWADPHNVDAGFARVRVRHEVLPVLEAALGPGIVEALARTATLARSDADALDAWADQVWALVLERIPAPATSPPVGLPAGRLPAGQPSAPPSAPQQLGNELLQEQQQPSELTDSLASSDALACLALPIDALSPSGQPPPPAIVNRVIRRFLEAAGCPAGSLTHGHLSAVAALLEPGAPARSEVALPGGRRARREGGALVVRV